jgi:hypothetical protein
MDANQQYIIDSVTDMLYVPYVSVIHFPFMHLYSVKWLELKSSDLQDCPLGKNDVLCCSLHMDIISLVATHPFLYSPV